MIRQASASSGAENHLALPVTTMQLTVDIRQARTIATIERMSWLSKMQNPETTSYDAGLLNPSQNASTELVRQTIPRDTLKHLTHLTRPRASIVKLTAM
mmetsp:Transcript_6771/g.12526  ORF Transcript_6771/g.12526 Transcript_6771/m.12526 type:complete len:99 (+) Transcript_6771:1889-2185(+)